MSETKKQPPPVVQLADAILKRCVLEECDGLWFDRAKAVGMIEVHTESALAAATKRAEDAEATAKRWSTLYSNLQDERAADFAKWFKMLDYGGLTEYQAECPQVIDDAIRQLVNWRWTTRMGLVVQAMASECAGKPDWAVLDVDGDMLGFGKTPMEAIEAAKKEVEGD